MNVKKYVLFNPPIYDRKWWEFSKPAFEEYKRKADLWDGVVEVLPIAKHLIDKEQATRLIREIYQSSISRRMKNDTRRV